MKITIAIALFVSVGMIGCAHREAVVVSAPVAPPPEAQEAAETHEDVSDAVAKSVIKIEQKFEVEAKQLEDCFASNPDKKECELTRQAFCQVDVFLDSLGDQHHKPYCDDPTKGGK